jgi:hypothetical protein
LPTPRCSRTSENASDASARLLVAAGQGCKRPLLGKRFSREAALRPVARHGCSGFARHDCVLAWNEDRDAVRVGGRLAVRQTDL